MAYLFTIIFSSLQLVQNIHTRPDHPYLPLVEPALGAPLRSCLGRTRRHEEEREEPYHEREETLDQEEVPPSRGACGVPKT